MVVLAVYALSQVAEVKDTNEVIVNRNVTMLRQLSAIQDLQNRARATRQTIAAQALLRSLNRPAPGEDPVPAWRKDALAAEAAMTQAISTAENLRDVAMTADRAEAWRQIATILKDADAELRQLHAGSERQISAAQANDVNGVTGAMQAIDASHNAFGKLISSAVDVMNAAIMAGQKRVNNVYEESRTSVLVALAIAGLLGILIAFGIRRSITQPLHAFMAFVERVGEGDLGGRTATTGPEEIARLGVTLNQMVEGLRQLARQSREATENLNASAAEIRASTQEQAASVEEQLAAVQETAATVDEITHAGAQIGKRAQEVIASAQATAQTSNAGLVAVDETARAMDAIREQAEAVAENIVALSEKTQAIEEITTTVNDISERSHLLALNAAIEAAGAGESGQRFAVVAAEMKTLADQAKEATAQVRSILGDIQRGINASVMLTEEAVKRVAAGKERTDTTQRTIEEITGRVQESVQTFQQIVASTNQQQLGIEQVMGALQNIRQASQQTAAGTRQLDSAAANLSQLSQQLLTLAERYRF
ncbi:methyl-accepting chemotaxis protein [Alsobacter soli]|uniref:Methyl-accepting chemotaxis protein n=2 Tax=Alsobacter soli TaxID=2109933 RepID=A0A2T1HQJ3_9HYPH|nr:methyl-accepting chemotaxis protein [Alsobacter soli]